MVSHSSLRLRRALPFCDSLLSHHRFHSYPKIISPIRFVFPTPTLNNPQHHTGTSSYLYELKSFRLFRSSPISLSSSSRKHDEKDITEEYDIFDENHWRVIVGYCGNIPAEEKIDIYEHIAARVFGSLEEARERIRACFDYGFQVECSEEISEKFSGIQGVTHMMPDMIIDPTKGDGHKRVHLGIIHGPPPPPPPVSSVRQEQNHGQMQGQAPKERSGKQKCCTGGGQ